MFGYALEYAHRTFQAFATWCRCEGEAAPIVSGIHSRRAWAAYQSEVKRQRAAARASHSQTRDIDQRQKQRVEAALSPFAKNRKPNHA